MWIPKRVLGISPHADDLELGAGGTIKMWTDNGSEVVHIIFSLLKQKEIRLNEIYKANEELGISRSEMCFYDWENRTFSNRRQQILQLLCDAEKMIKPDVVLIPSSFDVHQDHQVVHNEALRAFKNTTILGYEDPWNMYKSDLRLTIPLDKKYILAKLRAIKAHKSQAGKLFMNPYFTASLAVMRGVTVRRRMAESFEIIRMIL